MLIEFDLAGAEWVIVAYLSGDKNMIDVVKSGKSPHVITGSLMSGVPNDLIEKEQEVLKSATDPDFIQIEREKHFPEIFDIAKYLPRVMTIRQMGKKSNHGMNYGVQYRTFALKNEIPETDASRMVDLYNLIAYPDLPAWREREKSEFKDNRRIVTNLVGRKVRLLDKPGPELWNAICAFKPQSTVADIVSKALRQSYKDISELMQPMRLLAPVHDSVLLDYPDKPYDRLAEFVTRYKEYLTQELEVNGHKFTLGVDVKCGRNWKEMKSWEQIRQELSLSS